MIGILTAIAPDEMAYKRELQLYHKGDVVIDSTLSTYKFGKALIADAYYVGKYIQYEIVTDEKKILRVPQKSVVNYNKKDYSVTSCICDMFEAKDKEKLLEIFKQAALHSVVIADALYLYDKGELSLDGIKYITRKELHRNVKKHR